MKSNKNKECNFFLYQKDIHLIYLLKKSNLRQKQNKKGDEKVYPKIQLQENTHYFVNNDSLNDCILSKKNTRRNASLPLLKHPMTNKHISHSIIKDNKHSCSKKHEGKAISYNHNHHKVNLYKKEFNIGKRSNRNGEDKLELKMEDSVLRNESLMSELQNDNWFERKLKRKQEEKNNRRELNLINNKKDSLTERRKINIIGLKPKDKMRKSPQETIEKSIEIEERQIPSHKLYKSLIKNQMQNNILNQVSNSSSVSSDSERKKKKQHIYIQRDNFPLAKRNQKINLIEKNIPTFKSTDLLHK